MPMDVGGPATVTVHVAVAHNPLVSHTWYTLSVVPTKSAAGTNVMAPVAGSTVTVPGMLPASVNTVAVVGSSSALPALSLPTTSTVTVTVACTQLAAGGNGMLESSHASYRNTLTPVKPAAGTKVIAPVAE